jgi:hypothetical protein
MYNASHIAEAIKDAEEFGFVNVNKEKISFDWAGMKASRDRYIKRLNGIYESGLDKVHIERISGHASLSGTGKVKVTSLGKEMELAADSILIAVGGAPKPLGVAGEEHVIDSDGFFALNSQPKKVGKSLSESYEIVSIPSFLENKYYLYFNIYIVAVYVRSVLIPNNYLYSHACQRFFIYLIDSV